MATVEELRDQVGKLDIEMQRLINVKAEKLVNQLLQQQYTTLRCFSETEQEFHRLIGRRAVLTEVVFRLSKL